MHWLSCMAFLVVFAGFDISVQSLTCLGSGRAACPHMSLFFACVLNWGGHKIVHALPAVDTTSPTRAPPRALDLRCQAAAG